MKRLNDIISWVYVVLTILIGILLIVSVSGWLGIKTEVALFLENLLNSPVGIWTGIAMIIIGLVFIKLRLRVGRCNKRISFDNPEGEVTVSVKAVEDFIKKIGKEFSQVVEISPTIKPTAEGIKVSARTVLVVGSNIPQLTENIQHTIKSRIQNILGIENVTSVEVHVSKLLTTEKTNETPEKSSTIEIG